MNKKDRTSLILDYFNELYPNAKCELEYSKDYELVIAVMLSAQTTDASVNKVTRKLFSKYTSLEELANGNLEDIENAIKELGLYKNKAKNVIEIAKSLLGNFNGNVPSDKNLLQTLPGVGNKTAGVIRAEIFNIPDLPVDTHVLRVSKRLGLANIDASPIETERELKKIIPEERWIKSHHQFIHFGRYFCKAIKPNCENCKIKEFCKK